MPDPGRTYWPNRMIGDEQEPDDAVWRKDRYFTYVTSNPKIGRNLQVIPDWVKQNKERPNKNKITFTTMNFFDKDDPLLPSGLLGIERLVRYHPEGNDIVINNGTKRFNRALYGSNTAFRAETGDLPEFALYIP